MQTAQSAIDRQTDRQVDGSTDRQTDRPTDRQTNPQTVRPSEPGKAEIVENIGRERDEQNTPTTIRFHG